MKSIFHFIILFFTTAGVAHGQLNHPLTQYNQLPYLQNAALSGIEGYTDIKAGFKKQWATFKGTPQSYLIGVNHVFGEPANALHNYNAVGTKQKSIKVGLGGYVIENRYNFLKDTQLGLSFAVHVPVSSAYYLSLGLSPGYNRIKAETKELIARDTQDPFYLALVADGGVLNYFNMDGGMVLYSDQLYFGYSIHRLARTRFNSNVPGDDNSNLQHTIMVGYNINLNEMWELQPALLFRYESVRRELYRISAKFRYDKNLLAGLAYSSGESISILMGYRLNNHLAVNYSYDLSIGKNTPVTNNSHEIIIGIMPFNKAGKKSVFW